MNMNQQRDQIIGASGFKGGSSGGYANIARKNILEGSRGQLQDIGRSSGASRRNLTASTASKLASLGFDRDLLSSGSDLLNVKEAKNELSYEKAKFDASSAVISAYDRLAADFQSTTGFAPGTALQETWNPDAEEWEMLGPSAWQGYEFNNPNYIDDENQTGV